MTFAILFFKWSIYQFNYQSLCKQSYQTCKIFNYKQHFFYQSTENFLEKNETIKFSFNIQFAYCSIAEQGQQISHHL